MRPIRCSVKMQRASVRCAMDHPSKATMCAGQMLIKHAKQSGNFLKKQSSISPPSFTKITERALVSVFVLLVC